MATMQGRFIPKNPQKYAGDPTNILFRSSWEIAAMKFFDNSQSVLKWGSEEVKIPYLKPIIDPVTGRAGVKVANYFPDFIVVYTDASGNIHKEILEIKPMKEAMSEKAKSAYDKMALAVNFAKWKAAEDFAKKHGMKFRVITEKSLFKQAPPKVKKPVPPKKTRSTVKSPRSKKI